MESILWACNLLALVYLCYWAVRQDKANQSAIKIGNQIDDNNHQNMSTAQNMADQDMNDTPTTGTRHSDD